MSRSPAAEFSRAASTYERHAVIQQQVADLVITTLRRLSFANTPSAILELGCGTGLLTASLTTLFPHAAITAVDLAEGMLSLSRKNLSGSKNISFVQGDITTLDLNRTFDLIVSSSSLHWISPVDNAFKTILRHLDPNGQFCTAFMTSGTFPELRSCRNSIAPDKQYPVTLPDFSTLGTMLHKNSCNNFSCTRSTITVFHPAAADFIKSIHEQGVTRSSEPSPTLTPRELKALISRYDSEYYEHGKGVCATYEVALVNGIKENKGK